MPTCRLLRAYLKLLTMVWSSHQVFLPGDPVCAFWPGPPPRPAPRSSHIYSHTLTHTVNNADFLSCNCWWALGQAPTALRERRPWCVPLRSNFIKPEDRPETHGGQLDWDSFVLCWLASKSVGEQNSHCALFPWVNSGCQHSLLCLAEPLWFGERLRSLYWSLKRRKNPFR